MVGLLHPERRKATMLHSPADPGSARPPPPQQLLDDHPPDVELHSPRHEHVVRDALAVHHPQQHVLGADVVVPHPQRLTQRQLERLLRLLGERDVAADPPPLRRAGPVQRARAERLLDAPAHLVEVDAQRGQRVGVRSGAVRRRRRTGGQVGLDVGLPHREPLEHHDGEVVRHREQRAEHVPGVDRGVAPLAGILLRQHDDGAGLLGEPLEHDLSPTTRCGGTSCAPPACSRPASPRSATRTSPAHARWRPATPPATPRAAAGPRPPPVRRRDPCWTPRPRRRWPRSCRQPRLTSAACQPKLTLRTRRRAPTGQVGALVVDQSSSRPSGGVSTTRRPSRSTVGTMVRTNGTRASGASGRATTSNSPPGPWAISRTVPTTVPSSSSADRPSSWWTWNSSGAPVGSRVAASTSSPLPRRGSAASPSPASTNRTSRRPECGRAASTVSRPASVPSGSLRVSTAPGANRSSGESVRTATTSSPRRPCGRPTTPTRSGGGVGWASAVGVDDIHPHTPTADAVHHGAQGGGGPSTPADDLAQVFRVHPDLEGPATPCGHQVHMHVVRMVDDAPDQMFESVREHTHATSSVRTRTGPQPRRQPSGAGRPSSAAWSPRWWAPRRRRRARPGTGPACPASPPAA